MRSLRQVMTTLSNPRSSAKARHLTSMPLASRLFGTSPIARVKPIEGTWHLSDTLSGDRSLEACDRSRGSLGPLAAGELCQFGAYEGR